MVKNIIHKSREFHSVALAVLFVSLEAIVRMTTLSVFSVFGLDRQNLKIRHLEANLLGTTALIGLLICLSFRLEEAGWLLVGIGVLRILQIVALNAMTLLFGLRLLSPQVSEIDRTRWHFIALSFSVLDILLLYGFFFHFFNRQYAILNIPPDSFFDHFYYSMITIATVGYGDIHPVRALGKALALTETFMGFFLFVFLVNAVVHRFQRHID